MKKILIVGFIERIEFQYYYISTQSKRDKTIPQQASDANNRIHEGKSVGVEQRLYAHARNFRERVKTLLKDFGFHNEV